MNAQAADTGIAVIVNGASGCGHGGDAVTAIEAHFQASGMTVRAMLVDAGAIKGAVERAIQDGARVVVAGGGDGTLSKIGRAHV